MLASVSDVIQVLDGKVKTDHTIITAVLLQSISRSFCNHVHFRNCAVMSVYKLFIVL
jgi:hypothetical protein